MTTEREFLLRQIEDLEAQRADVASKAPPLFSSTPDDRPSRIQQIQAQTHEAMRRLAEIDQSALAEAAALERDESSFWFRRFFTSLAIANGAAFVALAAGFLQADDRPAIAAAVAGPMRRFAIGMFAAGAIPLVFWLRLEWLKLTRGQTLKRLGHVVSYAITTGIGMLVTLSIAELALGIGQAISAIESFHR